MSDYTVPNSYKCFLQNVFTSFQFQEPGKYVINKQCYCIVHYILCNSHVWLCPKCNQSIWFLFHQNHYQIPSVFSSSVNNAFHRWALMTAYWRCISKALSIKINDTGNHRLWTTSVLFKGQKREKAQLPQLQFINDFLFKPHFNNLYPSESAADPSALQRNTAP